MKKVSILSLIALLAIVISSCGSSNNVVSNHGISKRKYNKGFHFQRKSNLKTADNNVKNAELVGEKSLAKADKVENRKAKKVAAKNEAIQSKSSASSDQENTASAEVEIQENEMLEVQERQGRSEDGLDTETDDQLVETTESNEKTPISNDVEKSEKQNSGAGGMGDVHIIILVILAIIIPPLAVFLFEGVTSRFWIDLILALLGYGLGFGLLGGIWGLLGLIAVIYALLIVLNVI